MNRPAVVLMCALAISAAACEDKTGIEGTPSTVNARAYVDANGSGTFDTGDTPIAGVQVQLTSTSSTSGTTLQYGAQTDANGLATISGVAPGSYTASIQGNAPAGAVLSSATNATVVAPITGGTAAVEFRFAYNPGGISGVLFRDNNANGTFDTGDTPAPGVTVRVFAGTDTTATALATTTTDASGQYSFIGLRPGAYTLLFTPFPTITLVGGNAQSATVTAAQTTTANVRFTGNLIITIAEARLNNPLDSALVAVEGIVTAGTGTFNARSFYMQDSTAGILTFGVDTAAIKPQPGDRVRVVGKVVAFNQELEIIQPTVTKLGTAPVPTPRPVTGADVNAFRYQGELAKASNLRVVSVSGTPTSSSYNVTVRDLAGTQFVVRVANAGIGIPQPYWVVGNDYDVTGIMLRFNATGQMEPRSAADVSTIAPPMTIASIKLLPNFTPVNVAGIATVGASASSPFGARTFYVQDATSGVMVFFNPSSSAVVVSEGDSLRVSGVKNAFGGEVEIDSAKVVILKSFLTLPAPQVATVAEMNARTYEGMLVTINNVTVTVVGTPSSSGAYNVTVTDGTTTGTVRINGNAVGVPSTFWTIGSRYDITGIQGSFNATAQLKPRGPSDITLLP